MNLNVKLIKISVEFSVELNKHAAMDISSIYNFDAYQDFLRSTFPKSGEGRGQRTQLCKYLACRSSHISQVISGQNHLSLEMAQRTANFLQLSDEESHFFLLLVSKGRAGNHELSKYFENQITRILKNKSEVKKNLNRTEELTKIEAEIYYSSWHYTAIHILCSLPQIKSVEDIKAKLNLPIRKINDALKFLREKNIIVKSKDGFNTTGRRLHVGKDHMLVARNHLNWRVKASEEINFSDEDNLHFTGSYSLSHKDFEKIKKFILNILKEADKTVKDSPPEKIAVLCIDYFNLGLNH